MDPFGRIAETYDRVRPSPPAALPDLLCQLSKTDFPELVVDLGCGTGLSTRIWAGRAAAVVGIDPSLGMLQVARSKLDGLPGGEAITFQQGSAAETGLPEASADIVTCAQSLHWMEPAATLAEAARILRPGGVFAAYDYEWPPYVQPQAEQVYETFMERAWAFQRQRGGEGDVPPWPKNKRLPVLSHSGLFRSVRKLWLRQQEQGDAERFVNLALTNGILPGLLDGRWSEEDISLPEFRAAVENIFEGQVLPWYFRYHVRIGIR